MRLIKMLGLAMVAAIAAMAFMGTATAAAKEAVELCQEAKQPCPEPKPEGTVIKAVLEEGTEAKLTGVATVNCQKSEVSNKTTGNEPGSENVQQLLGETTAVSWTKCHTFGGLIGCTAEAIQLPWRAHLNQKGTEHKDGTMYVQEHENGKQPGAWVECSGLKQTFKVEQAQPNHAGFEVGILEVFGGNPMKICANNVPLKQVENVNTDNIIGRNKGTWNAQYVVTEPAQPLFVTHQNN